MFEFDGSHGEGGGDVLRFALGYSAISGSPVKINNIRSRRINPGLQLHHLCTVKALSEICNAQLIGADIGSQQLTFVPRTEILGGEYSFDIRDTDPSEKSGTIAPVIKAVLIPLAFSSKASHVVFRGATESSFSVPLSRLQNILLPTLSKMGIEGEIMIKNRSWYPYDGGEVELNVKGGNRINSFQGLNILKRGELCNVSMEIIGGRFSGPDITQFVDATLIKSGFAQLQSRIKISQIEVLRSSATEVGVFLFATYEHTLVCFEKFDTINNIESTLAQVCREFGGFHFSTATVDKYLSDQLILPCVLASDESSWIVSSISDHLLTNIWISRNWVGRKIELDGEIGGLGLLKMHKP